MKIIPLVLLVLLSVTNVIHAQAPQKFSYQTVIRNAGNQLVANQSVGIKISVLQGSATGIAVYAETHSPLTNANGLASLEIGGGAALIGNFAGINWANGPYFLKTETDLNGGNNYTIISTQQLLSVPYALYSNDVRSSVSAAGDTLFIGSQSYIIPGISSANNVGGQTGITAHTCGATNVHNPAKTYGTMTDQQGNVYRTIVIGNQEWMAENLKTSIYRNGEPIANVTDDILWQGLTTGACCVYGPFPQYECPYGKLYNWYVVADPRNVCPAGWRVPSDVEWNNLINLIDPSADGGNSLNIAGSKMKSIAMLPFGFGSFQDATNESGFSGLTSCLRDSDGNFDDGVSKWWSSTSFDSNNAWIRTLQIGLPEIMRSNSSFKSGYSIRCLKD